MPRELNHRSCIVKRRGSRFARLVAFPHSLSVQLFTHQLRRSISAPLTLRRWYCSNYGAQKIIDNL